MSKKMPKYRLFGVATSSAGTNDVLVQSIRSGVARVYQLPAVQMLFQCKEFKTLEEHALRICGSYKRRIWQQMATRPGRSPIKKLFGFFSRYALQGGIEPPVSSGEVESVRQQLQVFVRDGFLVSDLELLNEALRASTSNGDLQSVYSPSNGSGQPVSVPTLGKPPPISFIGIPTCNRPCALVKAAESYVENAVSHGRTIDLVIVDDSKDREIRRENRRLLNKLKKRYGIEICYVGREQRTKLCKELAHRADVPEDVVNFALLGDKRCGTTTGACRNTLLLNSAGSLSLQADDDTVCKPARVPEAHSGLSLSSSHDASEYRFYAEYDRAMRSLKFEDTDFLEAHEQLLGKPVAGQILSAMREGRELTVDEVEQSFFNRLPDASIRISLGGSAGASGRHNRAARLFCSDRSWDRLNSNDYERKMYSRLVIRSSPRPLVSNRQMCFGANIGFDHRTILPPFMPVMRSQDLLFGTVLEVCFRGAFRGYIPYVIQHNPLLEKPSLPFLPRFNKGEILVAVVNSFGRWYRASSDVEGMKALGNYLQDLGSLPVRHFKESIQEKCRHTRRSLISRLRYLLDEKPDASPDWRKDVKSYLTELERAIAEKEQSCIPSDLDGYGEESWSTFQDITRKYGELLVYWPILVETSKELRMKKVHLTETFSQFK